MRVPLSWLSEFIDIQHSPEKIAEILTNLGIEVDAIERVGSTFSGVVVGEVRSVEKHPDADKLCVAQVFDGQETFQVVCGASNCRQGLRVALAKVGAKLDTFKIKKSKLRGVESQGMLCSVDELGLGDAADGIMELAETIELGSDLSAYYADTVFDVSLTPNLGHCSSILGVARELAAATGQPLKRQNVEPKESSSQNPASVNVQDTKRCPKYSCRFLEGISVGASPEWMQRRLVAAGLRPINSVVDVTNYVQMELGHPLHAFDFDRIAGGKIIVREAKEGEKFVSLDDKERTLNEGDLLICDSERPIAIAGVMGGANSEVAEGTKSVLIESAYFEPVGIRKTSQRLGLQTDSSKRFERGTDPNQVIHALNRAAALMEEVADGKVAKGVVEGVTQDFPPKKIKLRLSRTNQLLGMSLSVSEVESTLTKLEMQMDWDGKDAFEVTVPTYRNDVTSEVDLIEEVARLYGYTNIAKESASYQNSTIPHSPLYLFERELRERLRGEGLQEFLNCDLISPQFSELLQLGEMSQGSLIRVMNPVSEEQSVLRTSLLPGFLELVKYNQDRQVNSIHGFEIGRVYFHQEEGYCEQAVAGIVLAGENHPASWDGVATHFDFFDLKGTIENLFQQLDIENVQFEKSSFPTLHSGRQASISVGELEVASIGEVHPSILRQMGIHQRVQFAEINLHDLMQVRSLKEKMHPLPKYPASDRDWTITLDEDVAVGKLLTAIEQCSSKLLEKVSLKALYRSDKLGTDKKNATFHFIYRDRDQTISQEIVEAEHARIIDETTKTLKI